MKPIYRQLQLLIACRAILQSSMSGSNYCNGGAEESKRRSDNETSQLSAYGSWQLPFFASHCAMLGNAWWNTLPARTSQATHAPVGTQASAKIQGHNTISGFTENCVMQTSTSRKSACAWTAASAHALMKLFQGSQDSAYICIYLEDRHGQKR